MKAAQGDAEEATRCGDRGYKGQKWYGETEIVIPGSPLKQDSRRYKRAKKRKLFCSRAGIEPCIGHLKSDYRLGRNFYKGLPGDSINVLLAAAAYNFKRAMKALWRLIEFWLRRIIIAVELKMET